MTSRRITIGWSTALLAALACWADLARADVIILRNHVEYRGAIESEDHGQVTILSDGTEWTFRRDSIARIQHDRVSAVEERTRDKRRRPADSHTRETQDAPAPPVRKLVAAGPVLVAANEAGVTVYGTSWCGYCARARAFFLRRGVPFVDKDIEADNAANVEMHRKCAAAGIYPEGIPVIDAFGTMVPGFDEQRLDALLKSHGY